MEISLTPQMENYIRAKVETGRYKSSSDVVRDALRLMEERDRKRDAAIAGLRGEEPEKEFVDPVELFDRLKDSVDPKNRRYF